MKIEYVCHACLCIDTGDVKLVTDPWFVGPSYCDQWHIFPKPVNVGVLQESQVILLSHGHEDHFHERSIKSLSKSAQVFYPYTWYGGAREFLQQLGYSTVTEAFSQKRYQLTADTAVTYIVNGMDSIIVIENRDKVLVNINDALHSYPPKIIELFVRCIKTKWERIDTVFCGFGGASYFPNAIHCPGKNDLEIGEVREQLFGHNFCQIIHGLQPRVAVPFAADFALVGPKQRWINDVRFPRTLLPEYFQQLYGCGPNSPHIQVMYSGDVLTDNQFHEHSPYWEDVREDRLGSLVDQQCANEIAAARSAIWICEADAESLQREMLKNIERRRVLFDGATLAGLKFCVKVTDLEEKPYLNITLEQGKVTIRREDTRAIDAVLQIDSSSRIFRYSFASDWGGDALTIGCGCDIEVFDQSTIRSGLDTVCLQLLTRIPSASRHWKRDPLRVARYALDSPMNRSWARRATWNRFRGKTTSSIYNDTMREWLFRTKCEVCQACDLPMLDREFAETL